MLASQIKKVAITASGLLFTFSLSAQSVVTGFVYADANQNNIKDPKEAGLAGVSVTNGREVVQTGDNGAYKLTVGNDDIIAVIKPAGFRVPVDANNLPRYYYIHKPQGSPALKYKGVDPTGPLPASLDFALIPAKEKKDYSALVFGDPQVYSEEQVDFFTRGVIKEVEGIKNVAFGLSMGDQVGDKLNLFAPYAAAVKRVGIPWYNMMGNHDYNTDVRQDSLSDESFEAFFGPATYAFNYAQTHFIILDDVQFPDPRDGYGYFGGITAKQFEFIKNDLRYVPKDRLVIIAAHIPISEPAFLFNKADREKLLDMLKDFPHTLSLSAHTHMQRHNFYGSHHHYNIGTTSGDFYSGVSDQKGIPYSTMRDGTPKGYAFIRFKGNKYTIDYKVAGRDKSYQVAIYAPDKISLSTATTSSLYANFFMGSAKDEVLYKINKGKWSAMEHVVDFDPSYVEGLAAWKKITDKKLRGRRPSNPARSTHLWKAPIPSTLSPGKYKISVKAKDMFGRVFTEQRQLLVTE